MNGTSGESSPLLTRTSAPTATRRVSRMGVGDGLYAPLRAVTGMGEAAIPPLSEGNSYTSVVFWLKTAVNAETQVLDAHGYVEIPPTSVVGVKLSDAVPVLVGQIAQAQKTRRAASQPHILGKFPIMTMAKIDDTSDLVTLTMLNVDDVGASVVYTDDSFDCVDLTNYPFDSTEVSLSGKLCKVHITEGFLSDEDNQFCGLFNRLYPDATWAGLSLDNKKHFVLYCLESMLAVTPTVDESAGIAEYLFSLSDFQLIELYTTNPPTDEPPTDEDPPTDEEPPIGDENPPTDEPPIYAEYTSASANKRKTFLGLALAAAAVYLATRE